MEKTMKKLCVILQREYTYLKSRELRIIPFSGNELATVLNAVVCIALLVWVTLTDTKVQKDLDNKYIFVIF